MFSQSISHAANIGFKVWGQTMEELFANAARALVDRFVVCVPSKAGQTLFVRLTAENEEELLVKWLEEILFHFETKFFLGLQFEVTSVDPEDFRAIIYGTPWDSLLQPLKTQIKGVVSHEMGIQKIGDRFEAQVILEV